jgi:multicomponent Na+:H+ antiporter subunit D
MGAVLNTIFWAHEWPGWPTLAMLVAVAASAFALLCRGQKELERLIGALCWAGLLVVLLLAAEGRMPTGALAPLTQLGTGNEPLVIALGMAIVGALGWMCAIALPPSLRRSWTPMLLFVLAAGGIGSVAATNLLLLIIWQLVIGAASLGLVLSTDDSEAAGAARSLLVLGAALALAILGAGLNGIRPSLLGGAAPATALSSIGAAVLIVSLLARLAGALAALGLVARGPEQSLSAELGVAAIAVPSVLYTLAALALQLRGSMPQAFELVLVVLFALLMVVGAVLAVGARQRAMRIAAIGISLCGLALMGAMEGAADSILFVLVWIGAMPAYLAASSILARLGGVGTRLRGGASAGRDVTVFLLALASLALIGLPPFSGFWPRLMLIEAAWGQAHYTIAAVAGVSSLLLAFALARRVCDAPAQALAPIAPARSRVRLPELLVLGVMSGLALAGGLYPAPFLGEGQARASAPAFHLGAVRSRPQTDLMVKR